MPEIKLLGTLLGERSPQVEFHVSANSDVTLSVSIFHRADIGEQQLALPGFDQFNIIDYVYGGPLGNNGVPKHVEQPPIVFTSPVAHLLVEDRNRHVQIVTRDSTDPSVRITQDATTKVWTVEADILSADTEALEPGAYYYEVAVYDTPAKYTVKSGFFGLAQTDIRP